MQAETQVFVDLGDGFLVLWPAGSKMTYNTISYFSLLWVTGGGKVFLSQYILSYS